MTSMDFQAGDSGRGAAVSDTIAEKAALIVLLDTLLDEEATTRRGAHRISDLPTARRIIGVSGISDFSAEIGRMERIDRKQIIGFLPSIAVVAVFIWYLFAGGSSWVSSHDDLAAVPPQVVAAAEQPAPSKAPFRDNSAAMKTALGEGKWTVGTDIPRGRYTITAAQGTGNIASIKANGTRGINEIFSASPYTGLRVKTVTTDIEEGEVITISHLGKVSFIPAPAEMRTTLSAGTWVAGFDVPAGEYTATAANPGEQGTLAIWVGGEAIKNEILGKSGGIGRRSIPLTISDGQTLVIHGLNKVVLSAAK